MIAAERRKSCGGSFLSNARRRVYGLHGDAQPERRTAVDRTVARLNVEHYRKLLARETDESKRQTLLRLLDEEEAKLIVPSGPGQERRRRR
jgi:hypothetical protein